jgi:hypothetical protein
MANPALRRPTSAQPAGRHGDRAKGQAAVSSVPAGARPKMGGAVAVDGGGGGGDGHTAGASTSSTGWRWPGTVSYRGGLVATPV